MARKKAKAPPTPPDPPAPPSPSIWWVHIAKDPKDRMFFSGITDGYGTYTWFTDRKVVEEIAVINCGQPLSCQHNRLIFEQMRGENAKPWTASQVLAAARNRMFGFRLVDPPRAADGSQSSPAAASGGQR